MCYHIDVSRTRLTQGKQEKTPRGAETEEKMKRTYNAFGAASIARWEAKGLDPVAVPYCDLQKTLSDMDRVAYYSSRYYGWRFDVYRIGNVYLTTGYAPVGRQLSSDICREAERIAAEQSPAAARRYLMDHIG